MKRTLFISIVFVLTIFVGISFAQERGGMHSYQGDTHSDGKISGKKSQWEYQKYDDDRSKRKD